MALAPSLGALPLEPLGLDGSHMDQHVLVIHTSQWLVISLSSTVTLMSSNQLFLEIIKIIKVTISLLVVTLVNTL